MKYNNEQKSVSDLMELLRDGAGVPCEGALLLPKRQRQYVWSKAKRMKLIDSLLQGMPIGAAFVHKKVGAPAELDDGGQRLVTLYSYLYPAEDDAFLKTISTKDGKPASRWAKKADKKANFVPFDLLDLPEKNKIRRAMMSVIYFEGDDVEADEMFRRLQLGDSLNAGQKVHARTAAPWWDALKDVEKVLPKIENKPKKTLIAAYALAIATTNNLRLRYNDVVIQDALDNYAEGGFQEAADKAGSTLLFCAKLDDQLKEKGKFYGSWDIATRYRILYNLLVVMDINKNNWMEVQGPLIDSLVLPLDDDSSSLKTMLREELNGRRTVDLSAEDYQRMFNPVRESLSTTVKPRDKRRDFSPEDRQVVYDVAKGRCGFCDSELKEGWHCHHVMYHAFGGKTVPSNAQALCVPCHEAAHRRPALEGSGVRYTKSG